MSDDASSPSRLRRLRAKATKHRLWQQSQDQQTNPSFHDSKVIGSLISLSHLVIQMHYSMYWGNAEEAQSIDQTKNVSTNKVNASSNVEMHKSTIAKTEHDTLMTTRPEGCTSLLANYEGIEEGEVATKTAEMNQTKEAEPTIHVTDVRSTGGDREATAMWFDLPSQNSQVIGPITPGRRVRIEGLQKRSDLNGQEAKIVMFDSVSSRYKCELISKPYTGTIVRCKVENLTFVSENRAANDSNVTDVCSIVVSSKDELSADDVQDYFESWFGPVLDVRPCNLSSCDVLEPWIVKFETSDAAISALQHTDHRICREYDQQLVAVVCHSSAS